MILDGSTIVKKNYVTFPDDLYDTEEQIQPNGVDLRLHAVKHVAGTVELPAYGRINADGVQIQNIPAKDGWFDLHYDNGNYLVDFRETITVPDGFCAIIITRSSLVRCGVDIFTGLWDTGFTGRLGGSVRIKNKIRLQYGARLGQVMFSKSLFNGHRYAGAYKGTTQSEFK